MSKGSSRGCNLSPSNGTQVSTPMMCRSEAGTVFLSVENHRRSTRTEVLQGAPLHLNCTDLPPGCLSPASHDGGGGVMWFLVQDGRTAPRPLVADGVELLMTRDNGLIVMDVSVRHNGTFICMLGGHTIAHHQVHVLRTSLYSVPPRNCLTSSPLCHVITNEN